MRARSAIVKNPTTGTVHLEHGGATVCKAVPAHGAFVVLGVYGTNGPDAQEATRLLATSGVRPSKVCTRCFGATFVNDYADSWR